MGRSEGDTKGVSRKQLPQCKEPYGVQAVTDTVVQTVRDGITTIVSINRNTKVMTGPHAVQSPPATGGKAASGATTTEAATGVGAFGTGLGRNQSGQRGLGSVCHREACRASPHGDRHAAMCSMICLRAFRGHERARQVATTAFY